VVEEDRSALVPFEDVEEFGSGATEADVPADKAIVVIYSAPE
jgi:hypothetical protein